MPVLFPRSRQHRVFQRVHDDLRIDALFLAQNLNGLKYRSHCSTSFQLLKLLGETIGLPLKLQVGLLNLRQVHLNNFARFNLDSNRAALDAE